MPDLLFEAGMEEIPARMIAAAEAELTERVVELLRRERLLEDEHEIHSYSTPRRLAVQVNGVRSRQKDATREMTGPAWGVAFRNGEPTPAALAFARKAGIGEEQLRKTTFEQEHLRGTDLHSELLHRAQMQDRLSGEPGEETRLLKVTSAKGEYLAAMVRDKGRAATEVLPDLLAGELAAVYWPKNMYWRPLKMETFVRPIRWIVALLDHQILPVEFAGVSAANMTYGHRILHGDAPVTIDHPDDYVGVLEAAQVTADVRLRQHRIRKALDLETRAVAGARWREDAALLDAVTHLTEWPSVVLGRFDPEYLQLPEEVLVTVMRDHQKYFAVEDAGGQLLPYFLAVLNTHPEEKGIETIRHGHERVLRARFKDAQFFWRMDQKTPLEERVEMLQSVTFHKELGTYWDKTQANLKIAGNLAGLLEERGARLDQAALLQATELAKTDLTTELVKEFTELQGMVGGLYARAQGRGETVARAIYWQYSPAAMEDAIPPTLEGQVLGIADRVQTIVAMFSIGLEPTGSKDPYALRRAANAIVKILAETGLPLVRTDLFRAVPGETNEETLRKLAAFFEERLVFWLREVRGFAYDVVNAVVAVPSDNLRDAIARAEALTAVRGSEDLAAIAAAFKRIKNILRQATEKGILQPGRELGVVSRQTLQDPAETALFEASTKLAPEVEELGRRGEYRQAMEKIATLRPHVDLFFDKVMVMAEDKALRDNRLELIGSVLRAFSKIADFSELVAPQ
ncbi:MAG TPA: glycine--tRNA ligase subunit beta [Acidobacteriaceae bacterium]|nr:glycine--tRNA ligase subunit beta [Acidobacteriaceae bacterium]